MSAAWKYFTKIDPKSVVCHLCGKIYKSSGNTTNVTSHLKRHHPHEYYAIITTKLTPEVGGSSTSNSVPYSITSKDSSNSMDFFQPQICENFHQKQHSQRSVPSERQPSPAPESIVTPALLPNKKRKVEGALDKPSDLLSLASKYLSSCEGTTEIRDKYSDIANVWAQKMRELDPQQSLFAEKAVNDILFEASIGSLNKYSVKINEPEKDFKMLYTSTPTGVSQYTTDVSSSFK